MDLSYAQNLEDYHLAQRLRGPGARVLHRCRRRASGRRQRLLPLLSPGLARHRGRAAGAARGALRANPPARHRAPLLLGDRAGAGRSSTRSTGCTASRPRSSATRRGAAKFGASYRTRRRSDHDAAALCETHGVARDRLPQDRRRGRRGGRCCAGADWRRFRPKVVLVEAVAPGSMAPSHAEWEPVLTGSGYRLCLLRRAQPVLRRRGGRGPRRALPGRAGAWDAVRHLYEFGRAPENPQHPDHALAKALARASSRRCQACARRALRALLAAGAEAPRRSAPPRRAGHRRVPRRARAHRRAL